MSDSKPYIYGFLAVLKLNQIAGFDCHLNAAAKRILAILSGYTNQEEYCWPSQSEIAKKMEITAAAVNKQMSILEEHGYIERMGRYHPDTKATQSSIIILNCDLARDFYDTPHVFSKRSVNQIILYLLTLLRYGGLNLEEVYSLETECGYTKKTNKKSKKDKKKIAAANSWLSNKEHMCRQGVTSEQDREINNIWMKIKPQLSAYQRVELDIELRKQAKSIQKGQRAKFIIGFLKSKLNGLEEKAVLT